MKLVKCQFLKNRLPVKTKFVLWRFALIASRLQPVCILLNKEAGRTENWASDGKFDFFTQLPVIWDMPRIWLLYCVALWLPRGSNSSFELVSFCLFLFILPAVWDYVGFPSFWFFSDKFQKATQDWIRSIVFAIVFPSKYVFVNCWCNLFFITIFCRISIPKTHLRSCQRKTSVGQNCNHL